MFINEGSGFERRSMHEWGLAEEPLVANFGQETSIASVIEEVIWNKSFSFRFGRFSQSPVSGVDPKLLLQFLLVVHEFLDFLFDRRVKRPSRGFRRNEDSVPKSPVRNQVDIKSSAGPKDSVCFAKNQPMIIQMVQEGIGGNEVKDIVLERELLDDAVV